MSAQSVYEMLAESAGRWPDRPVLNVLPGTAKVYGIEPGETTFADARARIDTLARDLVAAGYGEGMRVALLLENRPAFFVYWLALNSIGASVVPINPDLRAAELEYLIGHAEPALIVAIEPRVQELGAAAAAAGIRLEVIVPFAPIPAPRADAVVAELEPGERREAAILYTSGTTGKPKGCVLANSYFLLAGQWYAKLGGIGRLSTDGERMITPLPVFHMNAMAYSFMTMLTVGGCLTALDRFHPRSWWQDVALSGATCLHYLGVMPTMLMGFEPCDKDKAHSVRFGFGAGVDPELQADFEDRFGFPLIEAWAMTETGAGAVISNHEADRLIGQSCLGKPGPDVECRIVDDAGRETAADIPGELLVRHAGTEPGYGFFSHYYKNEEATREAWEGGWFHTGDIVRRDAEGRLFFVDRKKNVIRRSGENIAAVEVESILMRHPEVRAAGVAAVPDKVRGDEVFACLVVDRPAEKLAHDIATWCLDQMAYYKVPGHIAFVKQLPLTGTQKIQRAELKTLAAKLLDDAGTVNTVAFKKRQVA